MLRQAFSSSSATSDGFLRKRSFEDRQDVPLEKEVRIYSLAFWFKKYSLDERLRWGMSFMGFPCAKESEKGTVWIKLLRL